MDNQTFDLRNIRRYLDFPLKIRTIGYRPKNNWVHRQNRITGFFLCFVLKSEKPVSVTRVNGTLRRYDRSLPHMGLVRPGTVLDSVESDCKEELFFTYPAESGEQIENFHLRDCFFELTPAFCDTLRRIKDSFSSLQYPGVADRLDCLAVELAQEAMIASLYLERKPASQIIPDKRIFMISNYLQIHFSDPPDLDSLLRRHGLSRRTFYREWNKYYTVSPAQYVIDLRLKAACELLAHSQKKIYEIAAECGFCDPMYFNRCFTSHYGCPPLAFRKKSGSSAGQPPPDGRAK